ncbi:hypothetical protein GQ53DRAFT_841300 [Thozetella sp. PMI_491]|nr:hypothetical protein GQ53DRAFT_841300 [Thozetella sp. PMI_491]
MTIPAISPGDSEFDEPPGITIAVADGVIVAEVLDERIAELVLRYEVVNEDETVAERDDERLVVLVGMKIEEEVVMVIDVDEVVPGRVVSDIGVEVVEGIEDVSEDVEERVLLEEGVDVVVLE